VNPSVIASVALATIVPGVANADPLQVQVLEAARNLTANNFAFTQAVRFERTGAPTKQVVQRYDPRRGTASWTLVKVDDHAPAAKEIVDFAKMSAKARPPSYAQIADWFGAPATRVATTATTVTYRFAHLPKGAVKMGPFDASTHTSIEAVVNIAGRVPFVEIARFTSNKSFRMMLVVNVQRFVVTTTNRLLPDGHPVPETTATEFAGSFMGGAQTLKTRTVYSDFQLLR